MHAAWTKHARTSDRPWLHYYYTHGLRSHHVDRGYAAVCTGPRSNTYRVWLARAECRRASRFEPVAAVGSCSRTDQPTAESRKTPSDWRHKTATCHRRTSRPRSAPRTACARLSNTIFQAKAAKYVTRIRLSRSRVGER